MLGAKSNWRDPIDKLDPPQFISEKNGDYCNRLITHYEKLPIDVASEPVAVRKLELIAALARRINVISEIKTEAKHTPVAASRTISHYGQLIMDGVKSFGVKFKNGQAQPCEKCVQCANCISSEGSSHGKTRERSSSLDLGTAINHHQADVVANQLLEQVKQQSDHFTRETELMKDELNQIKFFMSKIADSTTNQGAQVPPAQMLSSPSLGPQALQPESDTRIMDALNELRNDINILKQPQQPSFAQIMQNDVPLQRTRQVTFGGTTTGPSNRPRTNSKSTSRPRTNSVQKQRYFYSSRLRSPPAQSFLVVRHKEKEDEAENANRLTANDIERTLFERDIFDTLGFVPIKIFALDDWSLKFYLAGDEQKSKLKAELANFPDLEFQESEFRPMLEAKDVTKMITKEDFVSRFKKQNPHLSGIQAEEIKAMFTRKPFKFKARDPGVQERWDKRSEGRHNIIFTVSKNLYEALKQTNFIVELGLEQIHLARYVRPKQCYICCAYGHTNATCPSKSDPTRVKCYLCAGDHEGINCDKKNPVKCINCMTSKKTVVNHRAIDSSCPHYQSSMQNNIRMFQW